MGVVLDVMKQLETHLLQANYDGFLRKGKIRGRSERVQGATGRVADATTIVYLWAGIAVFVLIGVAWFLGWKK